jgi:hypothetical protein
MANQTYRPVDPYADVRRSQSLAREGVIGFGETLRPEILREIGTTLGGLQGIGALRSGATTTALKDISERYGGMVGSYAKQATLSAMGTGLEAGRLRVGQREQRFREEEAERRRKRSLWSAIGSVLGAGVGFVAGPAGAEVGRRLGERIG